MTTEPDPAEAERAAVVAWLREQADKLAVLNDPDDKLSSFVIRNWRMIADDIQAGEHRKEPRDGR